MNTRNYEPRIVIRNFNQKVTGDSNEPRYNNWSLAANIGAQRILFWEAD